MNIIIFTILLLISLISIYIINKYYKKTGLIILYIVFSIISYLLSFKYLLFQNINYNANSISYVTMLTALYLLLEKNNKKEVNKIINTNFIINIYISIALFLLTIYTQSLNDTIGINMKNVFYNNYRILFAYPLSLFVSQKVLIWVYPKIKPLYDNIFISATTTYLIVGLLSALSYIAISYYIIIPNSELIKMVLSTYMIRLIITLLYSIYLTIILKKKVKKWITLIY